MTPDKRSDRHNEDLDKDDRLDKWRIIVWVLVLFLLGGITWILMAQRSSAETKATTASVQKVSAQVVASDAVAEKFTLAQQIESACKIKTQADDLGGLCESAKQIVKEGPAGNTGAQGPVGVSGSDGASGKQGDAGAQGPLGPKGERGVQGIRGVLGEQGIFGKTGDQGVTGDSGAVGSSGTNGTDGKDGLNGTDGKDGLNGADGKIGATGDTGANGPDAYPFTFTFTSANGTYICTLTEPDVTASCTS